MIISTIMVVSSAMEHKTNCYVKVVEENYCCDLNEVVFPKIHLIFLSKRDYNKINEIEKMCKKYFMLEEVEGVEGEKEYILYHQLKKIIRYLNECEVMEVLSDHVEAFCLMFHYITYIMSKSDRMRPPRSLLKLLLDDEDEDEDEDDEESFLESTYIQEKYETEKLKKKILKVGDLLKDKIRFQ